MSMIVFDMGQRIETPARPRRRTVAPADSSSAPGAVQDLRKDQGHPPAAVELYQDIEQQQPPTTMATAADIMQSGVITLPHDALCAEAWQVFEQHSVSHLPLLNRDNQHIMALLSRKDLLQAGFVSEPDSFAAEPAITHASRPVWCVEPDAELSELLDLLVWHSIGCLPVVHQQHDQQQLAGIITRSDLLRLLAQNTELSIKV